MVLLLLPMLLWREVVSGSVYQERRDHQDRTTLPSPTSTEHATHSLVVMILDKLYPTNDPIYPGLRQYADDIEAPVERRGLSAKVHIYGQDRVNIPR